MGLTFGSLPGGTAGLLQAHRAVVPSGSRIAKPFRRAARGAFGAGAPAGLTPLPKDGATTLDFIKAFNPFCAVNDSVR